MKNQNLFCFGFVFGDLNVCLCAIEIWKQNLRLDPLTVNIVLSGMLYLTPPPQKKQSCYNFFIQFSSIRLIELIQWFIRSKAYFCIYCWHMVNQVIYHFGIILGGGNMKKIIKFQNFQNIYSNKIPPSPESLGKACFIYNWFQLELIFKIFVQISWHTSK